MKLFMIKNTTNLLKKGKLSEMTKEKIEKFSKVEIFSEVEIFLGD